MKKLFYLSLLSLAFIACKNNQEKVTVEEVVETNQAPDMHTSQIALDWQGVYSGLLPCADCDGIKTEITFNDDESYLIRRKYLGKDETVFEEKGKLEWSEDGSSVVLTNKEDGHATLFKVGENHLKQLDIEGYPIEGELAEMYILRKN